MKRNRLTSVLAAALATTMAFTACGSSNSNSGNDSSKSNDTTTSADSKNEESADGYEVALVTDIGTIDDKSFNQGAWEGVEKYGEESVAILTDFIEAVGKSGKKNEIIEEWENLIINFYKRSNSKKIFEGQLILAYQSRLGNARNSSKVNVASWVKKMFFYKEQSQISNLQEIMRKSSFSSSALKNIGEKIDENDATWLESTVDFYWFLVFESFILSSSICFFQCFFFRCE